MTAAPRIALILGMALGALAACQSSSTGPSSGTQSQEAGRRALANFLTTAGALGQGEVTISRLAASKAANPAVRSFAAAVVADQAPLNDQLASMAQSRQVDLPTEMDGRHATLYQRLQTLNGGLFDQAYLESQLQDRTMLIQAFQDQADSGTDPQVRDFAKQRLPELMQSLHAAYILAGGI